MKITQQLIARSIGTLLLIFSVAFICIPYSLGGHPGEPMTSTATDYHLT